MFGPGLLVRVCLGPCHPFGSADWIQLPYHFQTRAARWGWWWAKDTTVWTCCEFTGNSIVNCINHWIWLRTHPNSGRVWVDDSVRFLLHKRWWSLLLNHDIRIYTTFKYMYCIYNYIIIIKNWIETLFRGDSKWPFHPLVGGHLTIPKRVTKNCQVKDILREWIWWLSPPEATASATTMSCDLRLSL